MSDDADRWEVIRKARETLQRVDDAERRRRFEEQQRGPVEDAEPVANWRGCATTAAMTVSQFNQYCRDGMPGLKASTPVIQNSTVTKSKVAAMVRSAVEQERATMQAAMEVAVAIVGEECGKNESRLRSDFKAEFDKLRAEIRELKFGDAGVLDLPDWKSYAAH
jgi:hypothetical protein